MNKIRQFFTNIFKKNDQKVLAKENEKVLAKENEKVLAKEENEIKHLKTKIRPKRQGIIKKKKTLENKKNQNKIKVTYRISKELKVQIIAISRDQKVSQSSVIEMLAKKSLKNMQKSAKNDKKKK